MDDLYQILGVTKTATSDQIKKAYRDAAFKYHPDRNPGNKTYEEKFKEINAAYAVLGDETKRSQYDRYGSTDTYATHTQNAYEQSPFGDDFWAWYQQQANAQQRHYRQTYSSGAKPEPQTKAEAFRALIRSAFLFLFSILFLRWSWLLLPIGPILCLLGIVRGASGFVQSIYSLFKPHSKKG
ncbi:MAG TPA: DnaJ domain-containing protein [Treponemataceae bacterium]|nr:DnaJ domain-containing protein [Treponemataceae bacterium]